jgi:hypothetical protein
LAYVTGLVNQALLLQNEYLAAENRSSPAQEFRILDYVHVQRQVGRNWIGRCPSCAAANQPGDFRRGAAQVHLLGGLHQGDDPNGRRPANSREEVRIMSSSTTSSKATPGPASVRADFTIGRNETA